ncbi:hypothetical protein BDA99DRAFT_513181 [Phascolomyces articulosus]|uniref:Phosphodiesterase n=1 Tax=Phascolomyces articulosus TaxID=60185 RepID=A0AAD5K818_9FUNG|nr:hypothetical protein BDA99DRAFT_513181 [Phascolomyces articulosus]
MLILRHNNLSVEDLFQIESKMLKIADPKQPYTYSLGFTLLDKPRAMIYGILLGYAERLGVFKTLDISPSEFLDFLIDVDLGYHVNPYHSFYHAADVTIVIYHMLFQFEVLNYLSRIDVAALFIAALCHDIGHPGCNNNYQVNLQTELALRYNNKSVLESYSCTLAMDLISKHKLLRNVEKVSMQRTLLPTTEDQLRTSIIKMILSTDMVFHYELQENLASLLEIVAQDTSSEQHLDNNSTFSTLSSRSDTESSSLTNSITTTAIVSPDYDTNNDTTTPTTIHYNNNLSQEACYHVRSRTHSHSNDDASSSQSNSMLSSLSAQTEPTCCQMKDIFENKGDKSPLQNFDQQSYFDEDVPPTKIPTPITTAASSSSTLLTATPTISTMAFLHDDNYDDTSDKLLDYKERQMLCQILLHGADISNALRPWPICCKWSDLVCEEFFHQGELEKEHGLPVSPNMDRDQVTQTTIGLQFGDFVVSPYFEIFAAMFPKADALVKELAKNRNEWLALEAKQEQEQQMDGSIEQPMNDDRDQIKAPNTPDIEAQKQLHSYPNSNQSSPHHYYQQLEVDNRGRQPTDMLPDRHILNPSGRRVSVAAGMIVIPDELEERVIGSGKSRRKYLGLRSISDTGINKDQLPPELPSPYHRKASSPVLNVIGQDRIRRKSEEPSYYLYRHQLKVEGGRRLSRGDLVDKCLERQRRVASPR